MNTFYAHIGFKDLLYQLLQGGFQVPNSLQEDQYFIYLFLRAISVHLANLLFKKTRIVDAVLVQTALNCMDMNSRLDGSEHFQSPYKKILDHTFQHTNTSELDIELLVGVLLSTPPRHQDEAQCRLLSCIYTHFWRINQNHLQFQLLLDCRPPVMFDLVRLSTASLAQLPPPYTSAKPLYSLFQWLVCHASTLTNAIHNLSQKITVLLRKVLLL